MNPSPRARSIDVLQPYGPKIDSWHFLWQLVRFGNDSRHLISANWDLYVKASYGQGGATSTKVVGC